jgi:hypothetical protein
VPEFPEPTTLLQVLILKKLRRTKNPTKVDGYGASKIRPERYTPLGDDFTKARENPTGVPKFEEALT